MATRKKPSEWNPLATPDESAVLAEAIVALTDAGKAESYEEMRHTTPALHHALAVLEGMRGRHVAAVQQQIGQRATLHLASLGDLTHRMIVWDEAHLDRVPPEEQQAVRDDIEQRREFVRQLMKMQEAVTQ